MRLPSKYRNRKTLVEGRTFDSRKEANRWLELRALQQAGQIAGLLRQVRYPLVCNGVKLGAYLADFTYVDSATGEAVVEDVKGYKTRMYGLKKKLMLALHGVEIRET